MPTQNEIGERSLRAQFKFLWIAAAIIVAIGIVWLVAGAASHPSHTSDATAVGNAANTTPPVATNGGVVTATDSGAASANATPSTAANGAASTSNDE